MTREELEHAIRAACDIADDSELYVIGSQAILGQYPNAHGDLRQSMEVDIIPKNKPERWADIDGALGENSAFHTTHNFWVQGVDMTTPHLPSGWRERLVPVDGRGATPSTGWCLDGADLALSKLARFDDKDKRFVRVLLRERMVNAATLLERLSSVPLADENLRPLIRQWIELTRDDL